MCIYVYSLYMPLSNAGDRLAGTAEQIAARIRSEIEDGIFAPGRSLSQVELANAFGLSRIPIREALRVLEAEGYVTARPNKRVLVADVPALDDLLEIIEIRECVESKLMSHAVGNITAATFREATTALRALNAARTPVELRGAHERFHSILFSAARRPRMAALINAWRFRLGRYSDVDGKERRSFAAAVADIHARLLTACKQRDPDIVQDCITAEYAYIRSIAPKLSKAD